MKKLITLLLTVVLSVSMLAGCGGDPVADELEKYLNTDMKDINQKYEDLKTEMGKWEDFSDAQQMIDSIDQVILPNLNDSLDALDKIELSTDEVKAIRDTYKDALETYLDGFNQMRTYFESEDEADYTAAEDKINDALTIINDYNSQLEKLADEKGMTIEY